MALALFLCFGRVFGASPPAQSSALHADAPLVPRPCDFSCCACAERSFSFRRSETHANASACIPCYDWIQRWVAPEYKDYCGTPSCVSSPYTYFPHDYTVVNRNYHSSYDYPVDYYHADGSIVRHIPGYGNETIPPQWGSRFYGNGWDHSDWYGRRSYYYPHYVGTGFYSRHHRRSNSTETEASRAVAAMERSQIRATGGASVPTVFRADKQSLESPCDFDCCAPARSMFSFAPPVASSCTSCSAWVDSNILPSYRGACSGRGGALAPYMTGIPHRYTTYASDYMHDSVFADNAVVRHVPSFGDVRYPNYWSTPYNNDRNYYSNYLNGHYYYPSYSSLYYSPHSDAKIWTPATATWFYADM